MGRLGGLVLEKTGRVCGSRAVEDEEASDEARGEAGPEEGSTPSMPATSRATLALAVWCCWKVIAEF